MGDALPALAILSLGHGPWLWVGRASMEWLLMVCGWCGQPWDITLHAGMGRPIVSHTVSALGWHCTVLLSTVHGVEHAMLCLTSLDGKCDQRAGSERDYASSGC